MGEQSVFAALQDVKGYILVHNSDIWGYFEKKDTNMRRALPPVKRIAIVIHRIAQATSFSQTATLYAIRKSTVVAVLHQGITIFREKLVP